MSLTVSPDNQVPVIVWTCIEAAVGITAACLPNLRPLFKLGRHNFWSQVRSANNISERTLIGSSNTGDAIASNHTKSNSFAVRPTTEVPPYEEFKDEEAVGRV